MADTNINIIYFLNILKKMDYYKLIFNYPYIQTKKGKL
jgi:hypothetical protein